MQRAQAQQAELSTLIDLIKTELSADANVGKYFASEINWLGYRQKLWHGDAFRIGLVGITSSGKSTLVNALLGTEMLPRAVRPSSNSLVVCEWGERLECLIHFLDPAKKPRMVLGSTIAKTVKYYADEESNPGNVLGVAEIHLRSPDFKLGRGVALIDTPGLDAYGYDDHERLTLEFLLPTLDIVMFVTTCKANSDEKLRQYVCLVRDRDIPVMVVQNMIDSVEAKPGPRGSILKSKDEVRAEHRFRVEALLKKAGVGAVSIRQVSAIWSLDGHEAASGLPGLVSGVQSELNALAPIIADGRRKQLDKWLRDLIEREFKASDSDSVLKRQRAEARRLEGQADELSERYARMKADAERVPAVRGAEADGLIEEAGRLGDKSIDEAFALQTRIEKWLKLSAAQLSWLNKELNAQIALDCERLNLRMDDIDLNAQHTRPTSKLSFDTTSKSRKTQVAQSGGWGRFKRAIDVFNRDWGYDERTESWMEIADLGAFLKSIEKTINNELQYVAQFTAALTGSIRTVSRRFGKEVATRQQGIAEKMATTQLVAHRSAIAGRLEALLAEPAKRSKAAGTYADAQPQAVPAATSDLHEISVSPTVLSMVRLARILAQRRFLALRDKVVFEQTRKPKAVTGRVLILGFDKERLGDFVNRFWYDVLEAESGKPLTFKSTRIAVGELSEIAVALAGDAASESTNNALNSFLAMPCVLLLMIDIQQIGATRSLLARTGIEFGKLKSPIVLVVQSIRELVQSDSICEALVELQGLADEQRWKLVGVLVNDERLLYSLVADRLLASPIPMKTIADEQQFLQLLPERDRADGGKIVRAWRKMMNRHPSTENT
ncbi:dynamin family protein [Paraburkholderia graminis]|uniref:GTPase SAR1 family protein n=1 Tax=Paraburkholderia graminis TaxID=60548 RepID=A0ABD5CAG6_9BURK|nr:dynamin family protein [Paraburkholderia graminis]MDR6201886.1 GTPase SAR1 family protein [Paraburkholderia graminis]